MMATSNIDFSPYQSQAKFVFNEAHFSVAHGGIGSGKSMAGAMRAILAAYGKLGNETIETPNLGMVTAPTYTMLEDSSLRTFLEMAGGLVTKFNKNKMHATLSNGSEVLFRSADKPDRLRGPSIKWWWGDESAYCHRSLWKVMIGRLRQYGKMGYAWLTTTPKGRNWVWQTFIQPGEQADYAHFSLPTWANPFIDPLYYKFLKSSYSGDFAAQELEGDFIAFQGLIYTDFYREKVVSANLPNLDSYKYFECGVDWGFNNPGVILIGGFDFDDKLHIVHEEYQRHRGIDEWANVAAQLRDLYKVGSGVFWCDPSEPDYINKFREKGINAQAADNTVSSGIQAVRKRLVKKWLKLTTQAAHTISEFEQYQWLPNKDGDYQDQPVKANDHTMDALRYLIFNHDERRLEPITVGSKQHV